MARRLSVFDVDLAHAILDAELNLFDGHAPRGFQLAAVLVDDVLQMLGTLEEPCITR